MSLDLNILFQKPEKNVQAILTVETLAPLSMVSTLPGAFYKTLKTPSKFHLSGAFENVFGWHFDESFKNKKLNAKGKKENLRRQIKIRVEKYFEKENLPPIIWEISEVGYEPLVAHLFEPNITLTSTPIF